MAGFRALSTVDVIRVAIKSYLQPSSQDSPDLSQLDQICWSSSVSFSEEDIKDVELVHLLLVSAENIGSQQYDRASKLLDKCDHFSSTTGNSVQRMIHHFSKALRERLNRETGRIISKEVKGEEIMKLILNPQEQMGSSNHAFIACYKQVPFYQATLFAGIQAIIENVAAAKRIHIIDLAIRTGTHWMVLMQALSTRQECPLELLKITMVGVTSNQKLEETGKRLVYFAETLNLPFSFKIGMLADLQDLKEDIFEINEGEVIAVYSPALLSYIATQRDRLETLITVLTNINPCVMVVTEVEANHHLQTFEERFFEALFHYSAAFDCLEVCMPRCDTNRTIFEEICTGLDWWKLSSAHHPCFKQNW
ncbi:DELLA protein [Melia azedarach]|uniref:DELLA protein n=1 Tax=Melia azedarach TaxID=155640 RepID=A0ACC1YDY5_MELAZ|nr:DELLA protein [Melia azedarach]